MQKYKIKMSFEGDDVSSKASNAEKLLIGISKNLPNSRINEAKGRNLVKIIENIVEKINSSAILFPNPSSWFLAKTAIEEAYTMIGASLLKKGYINKGEFSHTNHQSKEKIGIVTFCITECIRDISGTFGNFKISTGEDGPFVNFNLMLGNEPHTMRSRLSNIVNYAEGSTPEESVKQLILEDIKKRDSKNIDAYLFTLANERNLSLYASGDGKDPKCFGSVDEFEDALTSIIFSCIISHDIIVMEEIPVGVQAVLRALINLGLNKS